MLVEGQIMGGAVQGLGGILCEAIAYDSDGQLLSGSLMDYALPIASDIPPMTLVHQHSPSPLNPLGVKGVGEGGAVAPPAAVANAVCDALARLARDQRHPGQARRWSSRPAEPKLGRNRENKPAAGGCGPARVRLI